MQHAPNETTETDPTEIPPHLRAQLPTVKHLRQQRVTQSQRRAVALLTEEQRARWASEQPLTVFDFHRITQARLKREAKAARRAELAERSGRRTPVAPVE